MRAQSPVRNSSPTDEATPGHAWLDEERRSVVRGPFSARFRKVGVRALADMKFAEEWFVYCNLCCRNAGLGATLFH